MCSIVVTGLDPVIHRVLLRRRFGDRYPGWPGLTPGHDNICPEAAVEPDHPDVMARLVRAIQSNRVSSPIICLWPVCAGRCNEMPQSTLSSFANQNAADGGFASACRAGK